MGKDIREMINKIKNFKHSVNENSSEKIILYHSVHGKQVQNIEERVKSVVKNGLKTHDNSVGGYAERGDIIWFASDYETYGKKGVFVLSIEYNDENIIKYDMKYDGQYCGAFKNIPFDALKVIKIPIIITNKDISTSSEFLINQINKGWTPKHLYNSINKYMYKCSIDLFEIYVQPHINDINFTSVLKAKINPKLIIKNIN